MCEILFFQSQSQSYFTEFHKSDERDFLYSKKFRINSSEIEDIPNKPKKYVITSN